jgi:hypothetical protein
MGFQNLWITGIERRKERDYAGEPKGPKAEELEN